MTVTCPACHAEMDVQTPITAPLGTTPKTGDLGMCADCGELFHYTDTEGRVALLTPDEVRALPDQAQHEIQAAREVARMMRQPAIGAKFEGRTVVRCDDNGIAFDCGCHVHSIETDRGSGMLICACTAQTHCPVVRRLFAEFEKAGKPFFT